MRVKGSLVAVGFAASQSIGEFSQGGSRELCALAKVGNRTHAKRGFGLGNCVPCVRTEGRCFRRRERTQLPSHFLLLRSGRFPLRGRR